MKKSRLRVIGSELRNRLKHPRLHILNCQARHYEAYHQQACHRPPTHPSCSLWFHPFSQSLILQSEDNPKSPSAILLRICHLLFVQCGEKVSLNLLSVHCKTARTETSTKQSNIHYLAPSLNSTLHQWNHLRANNVFSNSLLTRRWNHICRTLILDGRLLPSLWLQICCTTGIKNKGNFANLFCSPLEKKGAPDSQNITLCPHFSHRYKKQQRQQKSSTGRLSLKVVTYNVFWGRASCFSVQTVTMTGDEQNP